MMHNSTVMRLGVGATCGQSVEGSDDAQQYRDAAMRLGAAVKDVRDGVPTAANSTSVM
jgi:hypothetical protein